MSARTATQAMAEIRLAMGDAVEPLLQVIRSEIAQAAEDRTALARIAATRLDGEADEHGSDAAMASGDAVRVLDQVVRDARQAAGIIAFQGAFWRVETSRQWGSCEGCEARSPEWAPCGDGIEEKWETKKPGAWWPWCGPVRDCTRRT